MAGTQLGKEIWSPPLVFLEDQKKCPNFGKKGPNCVNLWVKFFIQNVVLAISRRKYFFPSGPFLCVFLTKWLSKFPSSTKTFRP